MHQAAKGDRHWREGIARTGCGLDEHEECAEHQYWFRLEAVSTHADLLSYRVLNKLNAPSAHLQEFHTSGMSHMRLEQS